MGNLQEQIIELMDQIPHLSDEDRAYWVNKISSLDSDQLVEVKRVLNQEKERFDQALSEEIEKDTSGKIEQQISQSIQQVQSDLLKVNEERERHSEEGELEQILNEI